MQSTFQKKSRSCCSRCFLGTLFYILVVILLLLVIIFVIFPIVFKYSVGIQRNIIFPRWYIAPKNYSDVDQYKLKGVRNFYVTVDQNENVTLGLWQILPSEVLSEFIESDDYYYENILKYENHDILLYLHGNGGDRTEYTPLYKILRKYFHIIACDYRGYADSTSAELTEDNIVKDIVNLYKWIQQNSQSRIFIWGHSLGSAVGTHTVSNLKGDNITPSGLVLEGPFTKVIDVMERHPVIKAFSWLPWFKATLINPIVDNGFGFDTQKYIVDVDSPIMILHAKDDDIIPYELATKLYDTAITERNTTRQGNVIYHLFEELGYNHMWIYEAPHLPEYVKDFIKVTTKFENHTSTV